MKKKQAQIRNLKTTWYEGGVQDSEAPVLFLIHGFPDQPEVWKNQFEAFSSSAFVIAPALRGIDGSEPGDRNSRMNVSSIVLDFFEILNITGRSRSTVYVVGHDIGGIYASEFAYQLGGRCGGVCFLNSLSPGILKARMFSLSQLTKSWYFFPFMFPLANRPLVRLLLPRFLSRFVPEFAETHKGPHNWEQSLEMLGAYQAIALDFSAGRLFTGQYLFYQSYIFGRDDPFIELPSYDELGKNSENADVRVISAGHWSQLGQAETVNRLVGKFLIEAKRRSKSNVTRLEPKVS